MPEILSSEALSRLEQGLPRLSEWGEGMLVPFPVRQLRHADVLWVNHRWFLERGVDVTDAATSAQVSTWLIATFGHLSPSRDDKASAFTDKTTTAYADRYGSSSGLAPHGGSGRAAVYGCFQAKGVGVTPLVGVDATPEHRNGCASIAEGIREAIYAEIAAAEFPHGAIPVIALLDTGLYYTGPDPDSKRMQKIRRGIVIRPSVLRPAHAERAALFKQSVTGYSNSQADDVNRTRGVVRHWSSHGEKSVADNIPNLKGTLGRVAEQAAFGQIHRLFNGGYFSSNLSVSGELHDFGNAYVLPDWANAKVLAHAAGFGKELEAIDILIQSLDFYFRKYSEAGVYQETVESLGQHVRERYQAAFARGCLRLWQAEDLAGTNSANELVHQMQSFFAYQQRGWRRYRQGKVVGVGGNAVANEWLYDALAVMNKTGEPTGNSRVASTLRGIAQSLKQGFQRDSDPERRWWLARVTAARLLRPRTGVDRGDLLRRIKELILQLKSEGQPAAQQVEDFIRHAVDQGRAYWPRLPSGLGVLAHVTREGCSALLCRQGPGAPKACWVEGIRLGDQLHVFDARIPMEAMEAQMGGVTQQGSYYGLTISDAELIKQEGFSFWIGEHEIRIPKMSPVDFAMGETVL